MRIRVILWEISENFWDWFSDMNTLSAVLSEKTAHCDLPPGEHVEVTNRVPLYTLARKLAAKGYGDYRLQSYTPTGTPSLRGWCPSWLG